MTEPSIKNCNESVDAQEERFSPVAICHPTTTRNASDLACNPSTCCLEDTSNNQASSNQETASHNPTLSFLSRKERLEQILGLTAEPSSVDGPHMDMTTRNDLTSNTDPNTHARPILKDSSDPQHGTKMIETHHLPRHCQEQGSLRLPVSRRTRTNNQDKNVIIADATTTEEESTQNPPTAFEPTLGDSSSMRRDFWTTLLPRSTSQKDRVQYLLHLTQEQQEQDTEEIAGALNGVGVEATVGLQHLQRQPSSTSQRERRRLPGVVQPGAVAVQGTNEIHDDGTIVIGGSTVVMINAQVAGGNVEMLEPLPATLAPPPRDHNNNNCVLEAKIIRNDPRKKKVVWCLVLLLVVMIGIAVGVGLWSNRNSPDKNNAVVPTQGGSSAPRTKYTSVGQPIITGRTEQDWLGLFLTISGDGSTLAVGAPPNVIVYSLNDTRQLGNVIQEQIGGFGEGPYSLSRNGAVLAIGSLASGGFVYQLDDDEDSWEEYGPGPGYSRSTCVSADGFMLAVGGVFVEVYQYSWIRHGWLPVGQQLVGDEVPEDFFGWSVSLSASGDRLAVGVPGSDSHGESTGKIQVFDWNGTYWTQKGSDMNGLGDYDAFGASVSLSSDGRCVAGGAFQNFDFAGEFTESARPGYAQVHCLEDEGDWRQRGETLAGQSGSGFGFSVDLSADGLTLVVGAPGASLQAGEVVIFRYEEDRDRWIQEATFEGTPESMDLCGYSVSMSSGGNVVVAGCPGTDAESVNRTGAVRVYREVPCAEEDSLSNDPTLC